MWKEYEYRLNHREHYRTVVTGLKNGSIRNGSSRYSATTHAIEHNELTMDLRQEIEEIIEWNPKTSSVQHWRPKARQINTTTIVGKIFIEKFCAVDDAGAFANETKLNNGE